jgi:hypothetical protein
MSANDVLQRAEEALRRHGTEPRLAQRAREAKRRTFLGRLKRVVGVAALLIVGLPLWGLVIGPVGTSGLMIAVLAFVVAAVALMLFPTGPIASSERLPTTELALLPLKTEEWLATQRLALPAPAMRLVDGIGLKLEALAPQLQMLDEREPAAAEVRRLIADELPELVRGYQRVPENLRRDGLNGMSPDKQLVEGLAVVDSELKRMSEQLATGDLNKVATQARYLELKYQGDSAA